MYYTKITNLETYVDTITIHPSEDGDFINIFNSLNTDSNLEYIINDQICTIFKKDTIIKKGWVYNSTENIKQKLYTLSIIPIEELSQENNWQLTLNHIDDIDIDTDIEIVDNFTCKSELDSCKEKLENQQHELNLYKEKLENKQHELDNQLFDHKHQKLDSQKFVDQQQKFDDKQQELNICNDRLNNNKTLLVKYKFELHDYKNIRQEFEKCQKELVSYKQNYTNYKNECNVYKKLSKVHKQDLDTSIKKLDICKKNFNKERKNLNQKIEYFVIQTNTSNEDFEDLQNQLLNSNVELKSCMKNLDTCNLESQVSKLELNVYKNIYEDLSKDFESFKSVSELKSKESLDTFENYKHESKKELDYFKQEYQEQYDNLESQLETYKQKCYTLDKNLDETHSTLSDYVNHFDDYNVDLHTCKQKLQNTQNQLENTQKTLEICNEELNIKHDMYFQLEFSQNSLLELENYKLRNQDLEQELKECYKQLDNFNNDNYEEICKKYQTEYNDFEHIVQIYDEPIYSNKFIKYEKPIIYSPKLRYHELYIDQELDIDEELPTNELYIDHELDIDEKLRINEESFTDEEIQCLLNWCDNDECNYNRTPSLYQNENSFITINTFKSDKIDPLPIKPFTTDLISELKTKLSYNNFGLNPKLIN